MAVDVQSILEMALEKGRNVLYEGKVASYIPELAKADSSNLGVCLMKKDGTIYKAGDYNIPFTMQSIPRLFPLSWRSRRQVTIKSSVKLAWSRLVIALTASCSWN